MKRFFTRSLLRSFPALIPLLTLGCGSASDPLLSLGSNDNPSLSFPGVVSAVTGTFSTSNPFLLFSLNAGAVLAPGPSLVLEVSTTSVTLRHNTRITSTISGMSTVSARPGDFIAAGSTLGTALGTVQWSIQENGIAVCPVSFLSANVRASAGTCAP